MVATSAMKVESDTPKRALTGIQLAVCYRSDLGNIIDEFYVPCLERAVLYERAVGYFTSSGLSAAAKGLAAFVRGPGKMMLVASPHLDEEDCIAIAKGYEARHDVVARTLLRALEGNFDNVVKDRLACLAWLVANDRLEIKVALPRPGDTGPRRGLYHEKIGLFTDDEGNKVAFSGSPNETEGGLVDNFESIDVFWSWDDPQRRIVVKEQNFRRLWMDETPKLEIVSFPEAVRQRLLQFRKEFLSEIDPESSKSRASRVTTRPPSGYEIPERFQLRDYQSQATKAWFENGCRGIYEMATGTGKTVTALCSGAELFHRENSLAVAILVPFQHLVDQWDEAARTFGLVPVKCYESTTSWREMLADHVTDLNIGVRKIVCAIATHKTASLPTFADVLGKVRKRLLVIGDEVHHLGAPEYSKALLPQADFRLGLSATPMRWLDPAGNQILTDYFDKTVFTFSLQDAIAGGFLCHYDYFPHLVPLEDAEFEHYEEISLQIARLWNRASDDEQIGTRLDFLLRERADVLNCAARKIGALSHLLADPHSVQFSLFYCAPCQIDDVVRLLAEHLQMRIRRFTAEESIEERGVLLREFEEGKQQGLVAMRCLDEGVDVPATKTAFILASSSNPREFVQRRGRILRTHASKKRAVIHDFIAVPPASESKPEVNEAEQKILRRELLRFKEFAAAADNEYGATAAIIDFARKFGVLDF